jgi:hypothetical protein
VLIILNKPSIWSKNPIHMMHRTRVYIEDANDIYEHHQCLTCGFVSYVLRDKSKLIATKEIDESLPKKEKLDIEISKEELDAAFPENDEDEDEVNVEAAS